MKWRTFLDPKTGEIKEEYPLMIKLNGWKGHSQAHCTFIERDAIDLLKVWRKM